MSDLALDVSNVKNPQAQNEDEKIRMFPMFQLRYDMRLYFAEFFGTAILLFFGNSVVANVVFNPELGPETWILITMGWGFGLAMALYVSMGNSGGHLNPAVTISAAVFGRMPWRRVPGYIIAQVLGGFMGAALTYGVYRSRFDPFDGGKRQTGGEFGTAGIFATYPNPNNSTWDSFFTEMILTFVLVFVIQGFFDNRMLPAKGFEPVAVGLLVLAIGLCQGKQTGYAINPARDLGPRIFTAIAGWGSAPFTAANHYFWVPIVAPICGGILAVAFYDFFIIPNLE
ncbi:hypothetical protein BB559_000628 [Furculomyces boomerangus]|uniref:Uncharacterized protein n=2 Tax=Harpellales TaxID=61421 RepID=A0A2T9Z4I8_9FUNG|nr:hypothetical protein BB559_000628 [Furculomyces boomerangus]PVZ97004.1 hypothetical protein BB558_007056 [Smittium angustum]